MAVLFTQLAMAQDEQKQPEKKERSKKPWVNPLIKKYGRILDLEDIDVKPDPDREYKILIELVHDMEKPKRLNFSANNIARLINLHAIGGVKPENLKVAVVVHAQATNSVVNNEAYQKKYKTETLMLISIRNWRMPGLNSWFADSHSTSLVKSRKTCCLA